MEALDELIVTAGDFWWTWIVLPVLAVLGIYFTVRSGVVQLRLLPAMFRVLTDRTPKDRDGNAQSVSSFQAFTISAASRVGVGNIAGVATAIAFGGPGAVFWMWTMAFVGGASAFIESSLAQLYKHRDADGFRGGPAYYMQRGLGKRWMGVLFAVILIICFPFAFSSLQANTIVATVSSTIGTDAEWLPWVVGILVAALTGLIVFGGVRRIAKVTESLVPAMALLYLILGIIIVAMNISEVPRVLGEIYAGAFGFQQVAGGALGTIIMQGVKRGMFSNEAGLGSAPNAGASAAVTHPVKQGLVQTLGVYFDTFLVCSITAFIILVSTPDLTGAEGGIALTFDAVTGQLGAWAGVALSVIVFLLAFSSIIGNYYYGESNIEFITERRAALTAYRALAVAAVLGGSVVATATIWSTADLLMGVMAIVNLIAIGLLSGVAFKLLKNFDEQRRAGKDPVFTRDMLPEVQGVEVWESVESVTGQWEALPADEAGRHPRR
ncbi:alanine/glycine:cation symporter family protein [Agrococcus sp. BE272]|uniref:alanine/glycine:cation symporter family protein n=1 Tax=Agrococcus sp. BE272 TaxID=2817727 RepID=UPI00285B1A66|nr:alanine/glycine:cation symporter family protein [Agrococcus sp. BE272]MDR7232930.1 AGCS family alanine or glycine:cation symporter [Agrococcus sp. BE272]